jgi:hypothetical protein
MKRKPKKPKSRAKRRSPPKRAAKPKPAPKRAAKPPPKPLAPDPPIAAPIAAPSPATYERMKEQARERNAAASIRGRDIGPIPDIADPDRRERCQLDFRRFCDTYNAAAFYLGWADYQIRSAQRIQEAILLEALYAMAEPRGGGKTTRCRMGILWGGSYRHKRYPVLIGAEDQKAVDSLDAIKIFMRFLPLFAADFPEISFPVQKLGGIPQKVGGQLCLGQPTQMEWGENRIILPTVPPPSNWPKHWTLREDGMVPTSGVALGAVGLTAAGIRGTSITLSTGEQLRPDVALIDDPQTRESARSPMQNMTRESLISADVLGMGAPGRSMSALMPCTIIYPGDAMDRMTDRSKHALWRGERTRILKTMPVHMEEWEKYFEVYRACALKEPPDYAEANAYYIAHREVLDEGAEGTWDARKGEDEISAIQHAMHIYCRDPRAFWSEYMNDPESDIDLTELRQLTEADLAKKVNQQPHGTVPRDCNLVTAFIDVQQEILFWVVAAWTPAFGGAPIAYGAFPEQTRDVFTAGDPPVKLSHKFPGLEARACLYAGLAALVPGLLGRAWKQQETDGALTASLCLIDSGYETDTVHDFIGRSPLKAVLRASKGKYVGPGAKPMNDYRKEPGDLMGWNWRVDAKTKARGKFVSFDSNAWKTVVAEGLLAPPGSSSAIYLPGASLEGQALFVQHLLAEYRVPTWGASAGTKGKLLRPDRRVDEWRARPEHRENHWWDGLVGCAVAASVLGLQWSAAAAAGDQTPTATKKRVKWSEVYNRKHGRPAA